jgi:hypothetical protein
MVQAVGGQPMGFWSLWYQFVVAVVVGDRNGCVVEVFDVGFGYAAVVVVGAGFGRLGLLTSILADGECRECIAFLQASLTLC